MADRDGTGLGSYERNSGSVGFRGRRGRDGRSPRSLDFLWVSFEARCVWKGAGDSFGGRGFEILDGIVRVPVELHKGDYVFLAILAVVNHERAEYEGFHRDVLQSNSYGVTEDALHGLNLLDGDDDIFGAEDAAEGERVGVNVEAAMEENAGFVDRAGK